ncbi:MAG: 30S ribosomal protein S12 methylthiotransferase RimO [Cytophagales bacterium]|nr:MAG: 30S ribosomal protein S12 methylthiotransferase RimO [Cytophagales bacterium]
MKTRTLKKDKVNIITLGCSKNTVDSENILTQLRGNQIDAEHESQDNTHNIIIINTCGFIDNAKQESIDTIVRYAEAKNEGAIDKLYVTGCLSERYKDELAAEIPEVDAYFGTRDLPLLLKKFKADYKHELVGERLLTTPRHYAYLKISEGCDRPCSFCAIPLMRGKHISTPENMLIEQARNLAKQGTKELILIAQDLTYYGLDLHKKRTLDHLLDQLAQVEGIEWIRLQYAYPAGFPLEILEVMQKYENICKYLDMPLQHASTNLLKHMRRGITKEKTIQLLDTIREKIPSIALRTTMIVGHPHETEADFEELCAFVEQQKFDRLGVFTYSHEENTHAYTMPDDIPTEIKQQRAEELMAIQQDISWEKNQALIGQTLKVLFDRKEGEYFIGRTQYDSPEVDNEVLVKADAQTYIATGSFENIHISHAEEFDLYGTIIKK